MAWISCTGCGQITLHVVGMDFMTCLRCGFRFNSRESPTQEDDFPIWEGESIPTNQFPERSPQYPHDIPTYPKESEICKCLGKIEGIDCNTYYFVSSVKKHGGCARRDCTNSFENKPEIIIGWENEIRREHKKDNSFFNVVFVLLGISLLISGLAIESFIALLGFIFMILGFVMPSSSTSIRYDKVNFKFVKKSDVPTHARDPWTQRDIHE